MSETAKTFEIEGELTLQGQDGGFASDAFIVVTRHPDDRPGRRKAVDIDLADAVAEFFGVTERTHGGERFIGHRVRIQITVLEE